MLGGEGNVKNLVKSLKTNSWAILVLKIINKIPEKCIMCGLQIRQNGKLSDAYNDIK